LEVASPSSKEFRTLEARHLAVGSASLNIRYPENWVGKLHAQLTGSGSVNLRGNNLQYSGGGRDQYVWRGNGHLNEVEAIGRGSGSINFSC